MVAAAASICVLVREQTPALADIDGSQLSSPIVHVGEQVTVNGLQMGKIKAAFKRRLRRFARAFGYEIGFGGFK